MTDQTVVTNNIRSDLVGKRIFCSFYDNNKFLD
jgi:hypothetical protein